MKEIKEALKSLLTKYSQSKYEQEIPFQSRKKKLIAKDNISKVITKKKQIHIVKERKQNKTFKKRNLIIRFEETSSFKMLGLTFFLNWIRALTLSLLLKLPPKKIEP